MRIWIGLGTGVRRHNPLGCFAIAVQYQAKGVLLRIDIAAQHFQGEAHQGALDLFRAVVLIDGDIQRDDPIPVRDGFDAGAGVVAIATTGDFLEAAYPLPKFASLTAFLVVLLQEHSTVGG